MVAATQREFLADGSFLWQMGARWVPRGLGSVGPGSASTRGGSAPEGVKVVETAICRLRPERRSGNLIGLIRKISFLEIIAERTGGLIISDSLISVRRSGNIEIGDKGENHE